MVPLLPYSLTLLLSFDSFWSVLVPLGSFGSLWVPLGPFGSLWVPFGPFGFIWVSYEMGFRAKGSEIAQSSFIFAQEKQQVGKKFTNCKRGSLLPFESLKDKMPFVMYFVA